MRWFLLLLCCYQAPSLPTSTELIRLPRELIECCPCHGEDTLARSSQLPAPRVDDCPCRARSADSEGASSVFLPSAVRPDGTHIRPNKPKEEQKNLLEPEVGLATSMLETLREATEEEYQDALARDAARSAADTRSDESKNLVIVVEPRADDEDLIPKASNVQESRWAHPLGSSLNRMRTVPPESNLLPDIHNLPGLRRPSVPYRNLHDLDTDVGASNMGQVVTDAQGNSPLVKTPLLRSNFLKMKSPENVNEDSDSPTSVSPLLGRSKVKPLLEGLRLPLIPKLKEPSLRNTGDVSPAPSSNLEILDDPENKPGLPRFANPPTLLKNLLKLKDVELIPKTNKLFKKPLFELPKMSGPKLRSQDAEKNCDDNASGESTVQKNSEINESNFKTKSNTENPFKDGRESGDKPDTEDCIDEMNISTSQDQDGSPSNIRTSTLENLGTVSRAPEDLKSSNDQRINDSDFDSTLLEQPKSTEIEDSRADNNCLDLSNSEQTVTDDSKMKSTDYFDNDSFKNEETASREVLSEDEDAFTDSSNANDVITEPSSAIKSPISDDSVQNENISLVIEDPSQISTNTETFPQNADVENSPINENQPVKPIPSLSDTLSAIRDNIKKLDQFIKTRNPPLNGVKENRKDNINEMDSTDAAVLASDDDDTVVIFDSDGNPEVIESKNAKETESVTLDDLQKLSDNLLDSSNKNQKVIAKPEFENQQNAIKSVASNLEHNTNVVNDLVENNSSPIVKEERSEDGLVDKTCLISSKDDKVIESSFPQGKSASQDSQSRDMAVDASEPIMSVLPKVLDPLNLSDKIKSPIFENSITSPSLDLDPLNLLKNNIVQPSSSTNPLNLLKSPVNDLINLNPKLPTLPSLDDIRDQISDIFDSRTAGDTDVDYDEKEIERMFPEASTTNKQTKLPTLKPLDNLNVDLFQLGPMKSPKPDPLGSNRKLNLNSFRTKVPVPKNFELKPVKLESSIRSHDGLQKPSPRLNSKSLIPRTKLPSKVNLLRSPVVNFPSLDEIRQSLHRNPSTLLGNPIQHDLSLFQSSPFDDLNRNAEKTMKDIKKRFRTSLKTPKIAEPAIADPQELLEDVGDKLKAIHYDLNDRLASAHDSLLESTKLALPSSLLGANDKKTSKHVKPSFRTTKLKPMRLQTLASTRSSQKVDPPVENSSRETTLSSPQPTSQMRPKVTTQDFAASDPVPVKMLPNSHIRTPTKDTRQFPVQRLGDRGSLFKTKQNLPKAIFRKPDVKENKVTITFEPTTAKPILRSDNSHSESRTPKINRIENGNDFKSKDLSRNSKTNTGIGRTSSFTGVNPWKGEKPVKLPSGLLTDNQKEPSKLRNNLNTFTRNPKISGSNDNNKLKLLGKENAFLSKVKDAVQSRLANLDSLKESKVAKAGPKPILKASIDRDRVLPTDMVRSASENVNAVAVKESLKENVSYKCKLVCTKE